jgi:hypothetical protein
MSKRGVNVDTHEATASNSCATEKEMNVGEHGLQKAVTSKPRFCVGRSNPEKPKLKAYFCMSMNVNIRQQNNGKRLLFCVQFVLHADMLILQRSAVLYLGENFPENG